MNSKQNQIAVANKAAIKCKGKYLILVKSNLEDVTPNSYDLPGGRMRYGEKPEESLKREVKEEAGLDVEIKGITDVWSFIMDEKKLQLVGITWACVSRDTKVKLSPEHSSFEWITYKEIRKSKEKYPKWLVNSIEIAELITCPKRKSQGKQVD